MDRDKRIESTGMEHIGERVIGSRESALPTAFTDTNPSFGEHLKPDERIGLLP
jgi:hypothetical protein